MIISKLYIENFGLFRGINVFDLEPAKNKPIVIFGGKNGSGKTTLFEAIKLCLYGIGFRGSRIFSADYEQYLKDKLHKNSIVENKMSVAVELIYSRSGKLNKYLVRRSWKFTDDDSNENLEILCNGKIVNDIEKDQWQSFITELIPLGISKLFFFDGEKIQNLANNGENLYLMDSFNSLLGLDVVERLKTDLRIYTVKETKSTPNFKLETDMKKLEKEKLQLENELEEIYQDRASVQSLIDGIESRIQKQEQQIASEGGGFANKIDELKFNANKLNIEITNTEKEIRELAEDLFPFAILPELCLTLKNRILTEAEYQYDNVIKSKLKKNYISFVNEIASSNLWENSSIKSDKERKKITENVLEYFVNSISKTNNKILHYFSVPEQQKILSWIEVSVNKMPGRIVELTRKLEKLTRERQSIESMLLKVPSDETLAPLVRDLNDLHNELGQLQTKRNHYGEAILKINNRIKETNRSIQNLLDKLKQNKNLSRRLDLTSKVQTVLDEYSERLRHEKINEFSDVLLQCFNHLYRKKKFIRKVGVDPKDFSIVLHDRSSIPLQRDGLSAGEKQIYAIAILWALARTSGKQLPFIIDTPLGRLDSEHRENLVVNFFHKTGKQVIIFSTNTEIDRKYFKLLSPYITKTYHLQYDNEKGSTLTKNNYFWKAKEVIRNEL